MKKAIRIISHKEYQGGETSGGRGRIQARKRKLQGSPRRGEQINENCNKGEGPLVRLAVSEPVGEKEEGKKKDGETHCS